MIILNKTNTQRSQTLENHLTAEASSLRLPPGQWPETIQADLGNCNPFQHGEVQIEDGEIIAVDYYQMFGVIRLTIFND
jgi:hypothetical protein